MATWGQCRCGPKFAAAPKAVSLHRTFESGSAEKYSQGRTSYIFSGAPATPPCKPALRHLHSNATATLRTRSFPPRFRAHARGLSTRDESWESLQDTPNPRGHTSLPKPDSIPEDDPSPGVVRRRNTLLALGSIVAAGGLAGAAVATQSGPDAPSAPTSEGVSLQRLAPVAEAGAVEGRHVVITGGNSGIGKAAATALAAMGMTVVLACRSLERGGAAAADISAKTGNSDVSCMQVDLASLHSVRAFAEEYRSLGQPLHVLINNAGIMASPQMYTEDGFEMQLGVNHCGHFLLTSLLLDPLVASGSSQRAARVVTVSSAAHLLGTLDLNDLNFTGKRAYDRWQAYGQSKLANILFTRELARRCTAAGYPVTANCMHPGIVDTQLIRYLFPPEVLQAREKTPEASSLFARLIGLKTPEEGASTGVYLAASPSVEGLTGGYYVDSKLTQPSAKATDPVLATRLWELSETLTGAAPLGLV